MCQYVYFCTSKASKVTDLEHKVSHDVLPEELGVRKRRLLAVAHMSAYVSIQYVSIHTVSIRQHTYRQHTSAYVSIGTGCMKASSASCYTVARIVHEALSY